MKRHSNPRPVMYVITARSATKGPRMHFDGTHFSQRAKVELFGTKKAAVTKARALIRQYPVLRKYHIAVADNRGFR